MRFLIAGAGAVGGFLAVRLADAGHDVTVLVRPPRAAATREHGLTIAGPDGTRRGAPVRGHRGRADAGLRRRRGGGQGGRAARAAR